jgi:hypothetical protein
MQKRTINTTNGETPTTNAPGKNLPGKSRDFAGATYYDVTRAAAFLGVHPATLKRETAKGHITSMKLGRDIWYLPTWIKDYLNERTKFGIFKA